MKYSWIQGPCHKHSMLEHVLTFWRQHHNGLYTVTNRLAATPQKYLLTMQEFNWKKWGLYKFHPEHTVSTHKTHVHHKPSGSMVEIPRSIKLTMWIQAGQSTTIGQITKHNFLILRVKNTAPSQCFFKLRIVGLAIED